MVKLDGVVLEVFCRRDMLFDLIIEALESFQSSLCASSIVIERPLFHQCVELLEFVLMILNGKLVLFSLILGLLCDLLLYFLA